MHYFNAFLNSYYKRYKNFNKEKLYEFTSLNNKEILNITILTKDNQRLNIVKI